MEEAPISRRVRAHTVSRERSMARALGEWGYQTLKQEYFVVFDEVQVAFNDLMIR
jgi:hypothetical protein